MALIRLKQVERLQGSDTADLEKLPVGISSLNPGVLRTSNFVKSMLDLHHPMCFIQEVGVGSNASAKLISSAMF